MSDDHLGVEPTEAVFNKIPKYLKPIGIPLVILAMTVMSISHLVTGGRFPKA